MLHAPGLAGVGAADAAEIAAAVAKTKTIIIVAISFLFISLLLWLGARFGRRGDRNDVRLRARGQDVDDVEVDSVRTRDRAVGRGRSRGRRSPRQGCTSSGDTHWPWRPRTSPI